MPELILHHYPVSPFAEKIRAILGYKKLAWRSVEIPMILPKPDVVALTGGYRRTPLLQIGADIYCDTALIARVLERIAPEPSIYPDGDTLAVQAAAFFADNVLFNIAVPIGFQPGGMIKLFLPDATPEFLKKFGEDRAAMRQGGTVRRGPLAECKANLANVLARVEAQLRGPFLFGARPCVADFSLYHVLWSVWKPPVARPLLDPFPKTVALDRARRGVWPRPVFADDERRGAGGFETIETSSNRKCKGGGDRRHRAWRAWPRSCRSIPRSIRCAASCSIAAPTKSSCGAATRAPARWRSTSRVSATR